MQTEIIFPLSGKAQSDNDSKMLLYIAIIFFFIQNEVGFCVFNVSRQRMCWHLLRMLIQPRD